MLFFSGWNFSIDQRESFLECGTSTDHEYQDCLAKINNSVFCSFQSSDVSTVSSSSLDTRYTTQHETLTIGKNVFVDDTTQNTGKCFIQRIESYGFGETL